MTMVERGFGRSVTVFRRRILLNSLSSWWYCACALTAEAYLLYRAVGLCCRYNELPWRRGEGRPVGELYAYVALIVANVMCLPFLVVFSLFQVGNYANDGLRLGQDRTRAERLRVHVTDAGEEVVTPERSEVGLLSTWRHVGPLAQGVHVLSAFCLLLPQVLVQAQEIKYRFLPSEAVWWSDLDVLLNRRGEIHHYNDIISQQTINSSSTSSSSSSSSATVASADLISGDVISFPFRLHPEFVAYCLGLFVYGLRYASVFWYTEIVFSVVFSVQLLLTCAYFAVSFCGTSVLYKILVNPEVVVVTSEVDGGGGGGGASGSAAAFMLTSALLLVLSVVANVIVAMAPVVVFNFGYLHFRRAWKRFLRRSFTATAAVRFHDDDEDAVRMETCCHGYTQHVLATVYLLAMVGLRLPIVFDYVTVYKATSSTVILVSLLSDVILLLAWVFLWFAFTVRQKWNFQVMSIRQVVVDSVAYSPNNRSAVKHFAAMNDSGRIDGVTDELAGNHSRHSVDVTSLVTPNDARRCGHAECSCHAGSRSTAAAPETRTSQPVNCGAGGDNRKTSQRKAEKRGKRKVSSSSPGKSMPSVFCGCASYRHREVHQAEEGGVAPRDVERRRCRQEGDCRRMTTDATGTTVEDNDRLPPAPPSSSSPSSPPPAAVVGSDMRPSPCRHETKEVSCSRTKCISRAVKVQHHEAKEQRQTDTRQRIDEEEHVEQVEQQVSGAPSQTTDTCSVGRGYRWNVRHKCGQYFRSGNCYADRQTEKAFRKRPPAPPPPPSNTHCLSPSSPSSSSVPICLQITPEAYSSAGNSPERPTSDDSSSALLQQQQQQQQQQQGHQEVICAHHRRHHHHHHHYHQRHSTAEAKTTTSVESVPLSLGGGERGAEGGGGGIGGGRRNTEEESLSSAFRSQSRAQLNGLSASRSADALDGGRGRGRGGGGGRTSLDRPHSTCIFTSTAANYNEYNEHNNNGEHPLRSNSSRLSLLPPPPPPPPPPSSDCFPREGETGRANSYLLNCTYIGSRPPAIPLQFPPPPPPPPPPVQRLAELKGAAAGHPVTVAGHPVTVAGHPVTVAGHPVTVDASSTDSTNSQTLCSQV